MAAQAFWDLTLRATDESYPLVVHIPHSLVSVANYRNWRTSEGVPAQWLYDMVASCFFHSQGGGILTKCMLEGKSPLHDFATNTDYVWVQVLAYVANYWSPFDIVHRALAQPRNPCRMICIAFDAFDAITATFGAVDSCRSAFPAGKLLPIMAGITMFNGGAFWRHLDLLSRGKQSKTFLAAPGAGVTKGAVWTALYWFSAYGYQGGTHRNRSLVLLTALFCILELIEDYFDFDPLGWDNAHSPLLTLLGKLRKTFKLGPQTAGHHAMRRS